MRNYANATPRAQARALAISRARDALTVTTDHLVQQHALVRLVAELAIEHTPWPEIEDLVRALGAQHEVEVEQLIPRARLALIGVLERRLTGLRCQCWACRGVS